jgi:SAM-dependent methyltransferase
MLQKLYDGRYYTLIRENYEVPRLLKEGAPTAYSAPAEILDEIIERSCSGRSTGKWLDVGGGIGAFASRIGEKLPTWEVFLNEHNRRSVELARDVLGVNVITSSLEELINLNKKFDVISAISVLEHIVDPLTFLNGYARLLTPGGIFVAVVPHFTVLSATVAKASNANVIPPFHVSLFNEDNLRRLFTRSGQFREISTRQDGPAAFSLLEHADYAEYWDVMMPTVGNSAPISIRKRPYPEKLAVVMDALAEADTKIADFFGDTDGRLWLTIFAQKSRSSRDPSLPAELGGLGAATTQPEHTTNAPRDLVNYYYQAFNRENTALTRENARLNDFSRAEIVRLNAVISEMSSSSSAEIARLNEVYPVEIARLNAVLSETTSSLSGEIARLNEVYPVEIARLNALLSETTSSLSGEIARLNEVYPVEIARLNAVLSETTSSLSGEIARLNEVYPAEIARLNAILSEISSRSSVEIVRLNEVYPAEIARLNAALSDLSSSSAKEIARLNEVYPAEIARLNAVLGDMNSSLSGEIARLNEVYPVEIARLNAVISDLSSSSASEIAALKESHGAEIAHLNETREAEIARLSAEKERLQQLLPMRVMMKLKGLR